MKHCEHGTDADWCRRSYKCMYHAQSRFFSIASVACVMVALLIACFGDAEWVPLVLVLYVCGGANLVLAWRWFRLAIR